MFCPRKGSRIRETDLIERVYVPQVPPNPNSYPKIKDPEFCPQERARCRLPYRVPLKGS